MKKYLLLIFISVIFNDRADCQLQGDGCGYVPPSLRNPISAASLEKLKMTPSVIKYNLNTDVIFEVYVIGTVSKLSLNIDNKANDFNDSGINGDKKANDNIYSLKYPSSAIISRLKDTDAYRPFLGFVEIYENGVKM